MFAEYSAIQCHAAGNDVQQTSGVVFTRLCLDFDLQERCFIFMDVFLRSAPNSCTCYWPLTIWVDLPDAEDVPTTHIIGHWNISMEKLGREERATQVS